MGHKNEIACAWNAILLFSLAFFMNSGQLSP